MLNQKDWYIAAGSIIVPKEQSRLEPDIWSSTQLRSWTPFHPLPSCDLSSGMLEDGNVLPNEVQTVLLTASPLSILRPLLQAGWVKLEFLIRDADQGGCEDLSFTRVYLLPDDAQRSSIDRSDSNLLKTRRQLLAILNYSLDAWIGNNPSTYSASPASYQSQTEDDTTLLKLFNTLPSPNPNEDLVPEPNIRDSMYDLLQSNVPGLTTTLYPYQRESAATMLQKEAQPSQVPDPRLQHVKDQNGASWYFDSVTGTTLSEPRYYDGVSGGILAEEMGSGKTLICLALILATKDLSTKPPAIYEAGEAPRRKKVASLVEMAASCATQHGVSWKRYFNSCQTEFGYEFRHCIQALEHHPGFYLIPPPKLRRGERRPNAHHGTSLPKKIYLSSATLVIVPNNLVAQWVQEIAKHTQGLRVLTLQKKDRLPPAREFLNYDVVLFSQTRFEMTVRGKKIAETLGSEDLNDADLALRGTGLFPEDLQAPLLSVHFQRCIVDEGHKLGNSKISSKSNLLLGLDQLHLSSRWIVTGTPSVGLFGVDQKPLELRNRDGTNNQDANQLNESSTELEKKDLERIGSIAVLYLKARPWSNTILETSDTPADWNTYLMLPRHTAKGQGRWDSVRSTLGSLILRHKLHEIKTLLPNVHERIVVLDGSYQDQLSLNLFSMMIIFNSVQSQRTDEDYFFHSRQRKSLLLIVQNLKQSSFFGGSFFSSDEIAKAVETAQEFLEKKTVPISAEDEWLLQQAIEFGRVATSNTLRKLSNQFHEIPVGVRGFPGGAGQHWSLDGEEGEVICSSASLLLAAQKLIHSAAGEPAEINLLLNGRLMQEGIAERERLLLTESTGKKSESKNGKVGTLAGNTKLGNDSRRKSRSNGINGVLSTTPLTAENFSGPLRLTEITTTVSAKLSYLLDNIARYQDEEKIIVFYENENVAWYLASMFDVLQIQNLIYAKGLTTERRAQYVDTFNESPTFRVLLMDISQAAFGLDMRAASRIYFINPVINPQVEAQAIGRARRISQQNAVTVETLVLKNSIDEVLLERKTHMTQAEHRRVKSILDIRPVYNWIKNARIVPLPETDGSSVSQMTPCRPQKVFGGGFGRTLHPNDGLVLRNCETRVSGSQEVAGSLSHPTDSRKRRQDGDLANTTLTFEGEVAGETKDVLPPPARRVRFASD